jgi:CRP-like cAMP-binding protein
MIADFNIHPGLFQALNKHAGFTRSEYTLFCSFLEVRTVKKKEFYLQPGEICRATAYVNSGCLRRYILDDHAKEIIVNFALEDWWIGDLESFFQQKPTIYYIQALEESELLVLRLENFRRLCEKIPKYKIFHDEKIQRNHYATLKRLALSKSGTPEEKYLLLMKELPQLFQRIPLHYIASYLGIEPESLSRLRKRLTDKPQKS